MIFLVVLFLVVVDLEFKEDFCIVDCLSWVYVNGYVCKDWLKVSNEDFVYWGLCKLFKSFLFFFSVVMIFVFVFEFLGLNI